MIGFQVVRNKANSQGKTRLRWPRHETLCGVVTNGTGCVKQSQFATSGRSFLAVVDDSGELAAEVSAVDDHVDEAVLEHELGGLEAVGQLDLDRLGDDLRRQGRLDPGA